MAIRREHQTISTAHEAPDREYVVCDAFNWRSSNQLVALRVAATRNTPQRPRPQPHLRQLSERPSTESSSSVGPGFPYLQSLRGQLTPSSSR